VAMLDDGLEYTHPDLQANFDAASSYSYNSKPYSKDPIPRYTRDNLNKHGTRFVICIVTNFRKILRVVIVKL